jgi:sialic acid synthase SpsE/mannose-6-phosphate isomerase-like protein (cupin superfamily)
MTNIIPNQFFIIDIVEKQLRNRELGLRIINELGALRKEFSFSIGVKFNYRNLSSLLHPEHSDDTGNPGLKWFKEHLLARNDLREFVAAAREQDLLVIGDAADEQSVADIVEDKLDFLSTSASAFADWPLFERIVQTELAVICSMGAPQLDDVDNLVAFLQNRRKDFALLHSAAEYDDSRTNGDLHRIDILKERHPDVRYGLSTEGRSEQNLSLIMSIAKGCAVFARTVGESADSDQEDYCSVQSVREWLKAAQLAYDMNSGVGAGIASKKDEACLLRRGVFVTREVSVGEMLSNEDVFIAAPAQEGQMTANQWSKYNRVYATSSLKPGNAVLSTNTRIENVRDKVLGIVVAVKEIIQKSNVVIPNGTKLEISHHYGLDRFYEVGAALITLINRDYCKKVIIMLPGQKHPTHLHKVKDETLHILHGDLTVTLGGVTTRHKVGDMIVVEPNDPHSFESSTGCVFEEISSTHRINDSFYTDKKIGGYSDRKTLITYWSDLSPIDLEKQSRAATAV